MVELLSSALTLGVSLGVILAALSRFIPNEKLEAWGIKSGQLLNGFGTNKMGSNGWEKMEDFLINSLGSFLKGVKIGLDDDEIDPNKKRGSKDNVRI